MPQPCKTQSAFSKLWRGDRRPWTAGLYPMASPFMVLAAQNPVEQEGTYRLPEARTICWISTRIR